MEVNRQVLRMPKIYQNAQRVVVWLGPEVVTTGITIQHLQFLKEQWDESKSRNSSARMPKILAFVRFLLDMLVRIPFYLLCLHWPDAILLGSIYQNHRAGFSARASWIWLSTAFAPYRDHASFVYLLSGLLRFWADVVFLSVIYLYYVTGWFHGDSL